MELFEEIEKSLTKEYRKKIWRPFMSAMKEYELVQDGDRIAVCVSGGKDSWLLAKLMQEYKRHSPRNIELRFICMDPGYAPENRRQIERNSELLHVPLEFFETDVFDALEAMDDNPCHMCAKMRRGYLYRRAQALGCNKIALGHHFDDAVETTLMSLIYAGQIQSMPPKLKSDNVPCMELIRPMYKIHEEEIIRWRDENRLSFLNCACRMTENMQIRENSASDSKRLEMKQLIRQLNELNPDAGRNIFRSIHNVNLDSMIAWKKNGEMHSFLDEY